MTSNKNNAKTTAIIDGARIVAIKRYDDKSKNPYSVRLLLKSKADIEAVKKAIEAAREQGARYGLEKDGDDMVLPLKYKGKNGYYIDVAANDIPCNISRKLKIDDIIHALVEFLAFSCNEGEYKGVMANLVNIKAVQ